MNRIPVRRSLLRIVSLLIVLGTAWFFYQEMKAYWQSLQWADLSLNTAAVILSLVLVAAAYFLATVVWHHGVNAHPSAAAMSLAESYAVVTTTQMTKYLPGKIWSYTLQTLLMRRKGVSASYVLYLNLVISLSLLFSASLCGVLFMGLYYRGVPAILSILLFVAVFAFYLAFIFLNGMVAKGVIRIANRVFRKEIVFFDLPLPLLLKMQAALIVSNVFFGLAGYAACFAIGCDLPANLVFPVSAATLFSDMLGFVVFLSPGGLGIREGAMFFLLDGVTGRRVALLLPLALRGITLLCDLIMGIIGVFLFKKYRQTETGKAARTD